MLVGLFLLCLFVFFVAFVGSNDVEAFLICVLLCEGACTSESGEQVDEEFKLH